MCIPVLAQLADSFVLSGVRTARGGLRIGWSGAISREAQEFLTTALVEILILSVSDMKAKINLHRFNHGMTVLRDMRHPST